MPTSRIVELAQLISSQTSAIDENICSSGLPQPSFEPGTGSSQLDQKPYPPDIEKAKNDVVEATIELRQLLEGPLKLLLPEASTRTSPLAAVHRFKIASFVPPDSSVSFKELAEKCGLLEHDLQRVIRYTAAHHRVFREPEKGMVAHTAASKLLAGSDMARDIMALTFDECWPAHGRAIEAMAQKSEEPNVSGYALANNTTLNTFDFLAEHPSRAQSFAGAMSGTSPASLNALSTYFDWSKLPPNSIVVDIGGSQGHVSVHLARQFPHLKFIVQDMGQVVEGAEAKIPDDVKERVEVKIHDMFTEQPVKGADVYLLRYVLHDWPDKYCVKVLQQLVPAMKKGAKVLVQDHLLPEPGSLSLLREMQIRSMDAIMLSLFNSREREEEDWKELFTAADKGFGSFNAHRIKENPSTGVMVAEWA
ncbi:hypothetical protein FQN54_000863 [Arachnomyces sp. PD_36]|nr:hypothetical protein FQN54_000863 [Arachnomyces sp. PD_36]